MLAETFSMGRHLSIEEFFKWYREKHGMTQRELADLLEVKHPHIGRVEAGDVDRPMGLIKRLYRHLTPSERERLYESLMESLRAELEGDED